MKGHLFHESRKMPGRERDGRGSKDERTQRAEMSEGQTERDGGWFQGV